MTKLKLPRKQKKALQHIRFTKRWLEEELDVLVNKCRQFGQTDLVQAETMRVEKLLLHPYPETKWIRKVSHHPFVRHIKETKSWSTLRRLRSEFIRQALKEKQSHDCN